MAPTERSSILFVTLSNIGDVILTTPVLTSLRTAFPRAKFTVVVGAKAAGVLEGSSLIDRLLVYDKWAGWSHKLKLVRALREDFYDYVVDLRNSAFPFLVRANYRSPIFRFHQCISVRDRHLEVLRRMKLPIHNLNPFDFFSERNRETLFKKLQEKQFNFSAPWGIVAPGAGSEEKRWRVKGFKEVLSRLLEVSPLPMVVVGDHKEVSLGSELSEVDPSRVVNLAGETTLRELAVLVSRAELILTNDSAVMHLGYELKRRLVALFGPTDPKRYGRTSEIWRIVWESQLERLPSERVFQACQELLNGIPSRV